MATSTLHLVDPQLLPLLETIPPFEIAEAALPLMRSRPARFEVGAAAIARTDKTERRVPGPSAAPEVGVVIYRPKGATGPLPCIFHVHGGGYITGSALGNEAMHRPLAADLGCVIISVEYRLAPETKFPGAVEDGYAALTWLVATAAELGVDTARIGVMGESAGGGLAAGLALLVRDRGEFRFAFQHLIYPMIDDRTCVRQDPHPHVGEFVWTENSNRFGWKCLLGVEPGGEGISPYAAVPVELHVYPGAFHGFQWAPGADVSKQAARDSRNALARAMRDQHY